MITKKRFEMIKSKYGKYASWAIWAKAGEKAKSNIGDLSVLDPDKNKGLLRKLKPNIVLVGLNVSSKIRKSLSNFHPANKGSNNDYKLRYALEKSRFWGAYMTDIIKGETQISSAKVINKLKEDPSIIKRNMRKFKHELADLGVSNPLIIALGNAAHEILSSNIKKAPHYSMQISKEKYKRKFLKAISR